MQYRKEWSTHIPTLIKAVQNTTGPVLELGSGLFSTPLLHWLCAEKGRKLVTCEASQKYYQMACRFRSRHHSVIYVEDWEQTDWSSSHWSVVLVDHDTARRSADTIRLKNCADFIVLHDSDDPIYRHAKVWKHFKYIYHWQYCRPHTSVVSNLKDLTLFQTV